MINKKLLETAQNLHQQGKLEEALKIYQDILTTDPDNAEITHIVGILYAQNKQYSQAKQYIDKAIQLGPSNAHFYNSKGNLLLREENTQAALECYQKAIQLNPKYATAHNNLANCLYHRGKFDLAEKSYQTAIQLNNQYLDPHYNYALLLAKLGRHPESIEQLHQTLKLNPNHPNAYGLLAEIYLQTGDYHKALINYQNRLQLQPNHAPSWQGAGLALIDNHKIDEAIIALQKALSLDAKLPQCYYQLGVAYIKKQDQDNALSCFFKQNAIAPMVECYFNIGVILMNKDRHKDAIEYLEEAAKLDPAYLPIYLNLGALYLKIKNIDQAIYYYQQASKLNPNDPEIKHILTALSQREIPAAAPAEYLQHLFDQYSSYYDEHLSRYLQYSVPEKIFSVMENFLPKQKPEWAILDLGCGTGLCGEKFKIFAKKLIGIDISEKMIDVARQKNIYDALMVGDIQQMIEGLTDIDLIIAGDVFTYLGNLENLFNKIYQSLHDQGFFVFSVEKTNIEPFILQQTIRYAHSRKYLENILKKAGFTVLQFDNVILRKQANKPIEGYLVVLQK